MIRRRLLGIAGAFAAAGLMLAPGTSSAALDKCSKEISKNAAKLSSDVQKGLQKCVDGWLKEEAKVAANLAKGKTIAGGASATLIKAAEKCEKEIEKVFGLSLPGDATSDAKGKIGKTHAKLINVVAGNKCVAGELAQLGHDEDLNIMSRVMLASGVNDGYTTQISTNEQSMAAFDEMGAMRCLETGTECIDNADCTGGPTDTCTSNPCPGCQIFGRAEVSDETTPQAGNYAGPCSRAACTVDGGLSAISNINVPGIGGPGGLPVSLSGNLAVAACDLPTVLDGAQVLLGGPDSTLAADLFGTPACLKTIRSNGWVVTDAGTTPVSSKTSAACADHDLTTDECSTFVNCTPSQFGGKTCIDTTNVAPANGDMFLRAAQRITVVLGTAGADGAACTADDLEAPGAPAPTILTSRTAQADLFDGGTQGNPGTTDLTTGVVAGAPFNVASTATVPGLTAGSLSGGTIVGAFPAISDNALLGDSVTKVSIVCQ